MESTSTKAIIFDFNGTLFFDFQENKDAWNEMSRIYRGHDFDEDEFRGMMGKLNRECAAYLAPGAPVEKLDEISYEKERVYKRLCVERRLSLEKDAVEFIKAANERGVRVMIASSAPRENMDWFEETMGLLELFDKGDIIAGRNDIKSKPAPDVYIYTQRLGGYEGSECICFEDAPSGLKAALGAGFRRVYAIKSPGMDWAVTGSMAPLVDWRWAIDHIDEVLA